ncbi:MAG: hypothetical protein ACYDCK_06995 [Thermoplasmatota archaeon]
MLDSAGGEHTPDIITSAGDAWVVVELTLNADSKGPALLKYEAISARSLHSFGLRPPDAAPDVLTVRIDNGYDSGFAQLFVHHELDGLNLAEIKNSTLRESLIRALGARLDRLPEIPITLPPEADGFEVRTALVPLVMEMFRPDRPTRSPEQLVDAGLERLAAAISNEERRKLTTKVNNAMDSLLQDPHGNLGGDLEIVDGAYRARGSGVVHPKALERIGRVLKAWSTEQTRLSEFGVG